MRIRLFPWSATLLLYFALLPIPGQAHDLYLVSGIPGAEGQVCARVGERFPDSTNAVSADRVEAFRFRSAQGVQPLEGKAGEGNQFCAALPGTTAGSAPSGIAEMIVHPRFIKIEGKGFTEYITGEGFRHVLAARQGKEDTPGREVYSRSSKLLIGKLGKRATEPLGHVLEIVPEQDPATLDLTKPMAVRVLFRGKPLPNAQIAAVYSGAPMEGHEFPVLTRTDARGRAELQLDRPGLWYARLIYMVPAENDPEVDWRSFFATLTFTIPGAR